MTAPTKRCCQCEKELPLHRFNKYTSSPDGLQPKCRNCQSEYHKKRRYGLTLDDFHKLWEGQEGLCAICNDALDLDTGARGYHIDHNHDTEEVRGILCSSCNQGLGKFRDSTALLASAITYLNIKGSYGREATSRP